MIVRNKDSLSFHISETSIRMTYNRQVVVFNQFNCPSRHKFNRFKSTIQNSPRHKYANINDIYGLANRLEIRAVGGEYLTVHKNIAY